MASLALVVAAWAFLIKRYPPRLTRVALDLDDGDVELEGRRERLIVGVIASLTIAMWMTTPLHGIHTAAISLIPIVGLLARTPWSELGDLLGSDIVTDALRLSAVTSVAATVLAALLGVPLAWVLARVEFRGRSIVRGLVLLPLILPPVVGGAALLFAFGRRGLVGEALEAGIVGVNVFTPMLADTPAGGVKASGYGYEGGRLGLDAYLQYKLISTPAD